MLPVEYESRRQTKREAKESLDRYKKDPVWIKITGTQITQAQPE